MSWKIFFTTFQFTCELFDALNQDYNKSFDFIGWEIFLSFWKFDFFFFFFNLTTDFENRQQVQWKVQAYTSISFRLIFNEKKKKIKSCILLGSLPKFR